MSEENPTRQVASKDEVRAALKELCSDDKGMLALKHYARERIRRYRLNTAFLEPDDLIQAAVDKLLAGVRHWPKDISFLQCVFGAVKSESYHQYKKERRFNEAVRLETQSLQETPADDYAPSSEALAVTVKSVERQVTDADTLDSVVAALADDPEALRVLEAYVELGGPGAKDELGITQNQLETVLVRIRRKLRRKGIDYGN